MDEKAFRTPRMIRRSLNGSARLTMTASLTYVHVLSK